jgi:hypothetical protein
MKYILDNWAIILPAALAFAEVIVRITPSEKDNSILNWIMKGVDWLIKNKKTGGGTHE